VSDLVIDYLPIAALKPEPRNARTHPKRQIDQIIASIQAFGFTNPLLIDENDVLIAGHGRLIAARQLGMATVPAIRLNHLSDVQKRALRIADNKIAQNAGWDADLLRIELQEITSIDLDLSIDAIGFSVGELDLALQAPGHNDPDDDIIPGVPTAPRTRPGDIWIIGAHRVGCGDCRDRAFMDRLMGPGVQADAAFLDPPYNVRIQGHANIKSRHREFAMASGEMARPEFLAFLTQTLGACAAVSRSGAVHFVCMDWRHMDELSAAARNVYDSLLNLCVWNKSNAGMGSLYRSKHELISVYRVGSAPHFNAVELGRHGRNRANVWDYPSVNSFQGHRSQDLALHPTVKPIALVADAIRDVTRRGEVVLDAFLGSGTTLLAAEREGRRFRGLDIDPAYVDLALARWTAMTGKEPRLEPTRENETALAPAEYDR